MRYVVAVFPQEEFKSYNHLIFCCFTTFILTLKLTDPVSADVRRIAKLYFTQYCHSAVDRALIGAVCL